MESRNERGRWIAKHSLLEKKEKYWTVPSWDSNAKYKIKRTGQGMLICECMDFKTRRKKCKHIYAVEYFSGVGRPNITCNELKKKQTPRNWTQYYKAQTQEQSKFMNKLFELCQTLDEAQRKVGRPPYSHIDMVYVCALKVYTNVSIARANFDFEIALEREHIQEIPSKFAISRFLSDYKLSYIIKNLIVQSAKELKHKETQFAVDSTGIRTPTRDLEFPSEYGQDLAPMKWLKLHAMCGVDTQIVTAVKVTERNVADPVPFRELLLITAQDFDIDYVMADSAYMSEENYAEAEKQNATLVVPHKRKTREGSTLDKKYDERYKDIDFEKLYGGRSNVESLFATIKAKYNDQIRSKHWIAQMNEILLKILCHNICVLVNSKTQD